MLADYFELIGFGDEGWGQPLLTAAATTIAVSLAAYGVGLALGLLGAWAKLSGVRWAERAADTYTTVLRGVPDLLVIYLCYFGGSQILTGIGHALGADEFWGVNGFVAGTVAVGVVSGAYQTEVLRGAYRAIPPGLIEAGTVAGMSRSLLLRRLVLPLGLRYALPGMNNVWQLVIKESALISVTGLTEILRQVNVATGSTGEAFQFYITGALMFLIISSGSGLLFRGAEAWSSRGVVPRATRRA